MNETSRYTIDKREGRQGHTDFRATGFHASEDCRAMPRWER
jgi:hypothetical protein